MRSEGTDEVQTANEPSEMTEAPQAESDLQGLSLSDTVSSILEESRESLSMYATEMVIDFETHASLLVESYRSELSLIVQETIQRRRRRRSSGGYSANGNPLFRGAEGGVLFEANHTPLVLSELSRAATQFSNEVERKQREQKRRVKRRAILLAPLIFVEPQHNYRLSSSSKALREKSVTTIVDATTSARQHRLQDHDRDEPEQHPLRRRKRSHRGFETFSQVDSSSTGLAVTAAGERYLE
jgi:hypothetical protein